MSKILMNQERGNVSIFSLILVFVGIVGTLYLAVYYGGFITRRQAQNSVDAAAITAAQELRNLFEKAMQFKVEETKENFLEMVRAEREACLESRDEDDPPCPTIDELIEKYIESAELEDKLTSASFIVDEDWVLVVTEPYFSSDYTAPKNGDVLYDTFKQNAAEIRAEAVKVSQMNEGNDDISIVFPIEREPKLKVTGTKHYDLSKISKGSGLDMPVVSATGIHSKDFEIDVSNKVPATLQ